MFKYYSKIVGLPYLFHTLAGNVFEICSTAEVEEGDNGSVKSSISMTSKSTNPDFKLDSKIRHSYHIDVEVDPNKLTDEDDEDVNTYSLLLYCQRILSSIFKSYAICPVELKQFFDIVKKNVNKKFPGNENKSIGAFYFLRFACSAISVPESYGLVKKQPSKAARRSLVLITKVLQNLANEIVFGKKEVYMVKMNDFLTSNIPKLATFYQRITTIPLDIKETNTTEITPQIKNNSLAFTYNHVIQNKAKIENLLSEDKEKMELKSRMERIINNIGEPFAKAKAQSALTAPNLNEKTLET